MDLNMDRDGEELQIAELNGGKKAIGTIALYTKSFRLSGA